MTRTSITLGARALALILAAACLLTGCASTPAAPEPDNTAPVSSDAADTAADVLRIGSLKGPTSIGLASMMAQDQGQFTIAASADEIAPQLLQGPLDIALVPANLAATLYQRTSGAIRVIDVNTLGVLYAVSAAEVTAVEDLRGRTVYLTGKGTVPEYTVLALLEASGLTTEDVDLQFRSEPAEVAALIAQDHEAVGILPQPYATSASMKDAALSESIDLTAAWEAATGGARGSLITGVTITKADTVEAQPEAINAFLSRHEASTAIAQSDPDAIVDQVVSLGIIDNAEVARKAIPLCNVVCLTGDEMKQALSGYLETLYAQAPDAVGGALPGNDFYLA